MKNLMTIFKLLLFPFFFLTRKSELIKSHFQWVTSIPILAFLLLSPVQVHADNIWTENFSSQNDKGAIGSSIDITGVNWTIDVSGASLSNNNDWFSVKNEVFEGRDLDGDAIWESDLIDISAYENVNFSLDVSEAGSHEDSDYLDVYYSIGGGAFTLIEDWANNGSSSHTLINDFPNLNITKSIGTATSLKIRVTMRNNSSSEYLRFDNVLVTGDITNLSTVPIAEYRMDQCSWDGSNNEVTDSVGSVNGTSFNGADTNAEHILCRSAYFDGVNDYVSMGDSFNNIFGNTNDEFTITAWIRPEALSSTTSNHGTANTFIAKASDNRNDNLEIGITTGGQIHLYLDTSGRDTQADFGSGITPGNWYFIAVRYDGSNVSVTINNSTTTDNRWSGNMDQANGSPLTIGTTLHSDTSFNGLVDEVKIYNTALSTTEINNILANDNTGNNYTGTPRTCQTCTNLLPVANAGLDQTITVGSSVTLDGSGSTDSDGTIASYVWSTGDTGATPTISGLAEGTHTITLTVTDDDGATDTDTVVITVNPAAANQDPVANAGADQTITVGSSVILDGSGSTDSDGTITSYVWSTGDTGAIVTISGLAEGDHIITLTVTDDDGVTDSDEVKITVTSSALPTDFTCANPRTYSRAYYGNLPGQIDIIGNSVVCQNDGSNQCSDPGNTRNNSINMMYINEDSDNSTFNHSSAELNIPADSQIRWAGLYWQGMFAGPTSDNQNNSKTVKLKVPGGSYVDITSDSTKYNWVYLDEADDRWMYQGVADITNLIDVNNSNGYYEIANLHTSTGTPAGGSFGAWSIVVVYYNKDMPIRNLTVFDGYQGIMPGGNGADCADRSGDPKKACEYAEANNCPIDLASTGVANPISVPLSGFLTPKGGVVESSLALFSGEGDRTATGDRLSITNKSGTASYVSDAQNPTTDVQNATISRNGVQVTTLEPQATLAGGTPWINTLGADIDLFDVSDKLENDQSSTVVTMNTSGDGYFPGVFAFSTELYQPNLCYDYAYKQYDRYFTEDNNGSYLPEIVGTGLSTTEPVTVELFIQNTEVSDISLSDVTVDIFDINTTQATYISPTTYVITPDNVFPTLNTDTNYGSSFNNDIVIGDIDSQDFFYLDYDLDLRTSDINMPLNIRLNYNVTFPVTVGDPINIQYETYLNTDIPLCSALNFQYSPLYGIFNVEDAGLAGSESDTSGQVYNLPTQTANRPGNFKIATYEPAPNGDTRKKVSTILGIELIDAGKYHGIDASCIEPDSALTPRVWVTTGNGSDTNVSLTDFNADTIQYAIDNGMFSDFIKTGVNSITSPGQFYEKVRENAAFRIVYNTTGEDQGLIETEDMGNGKIKIVNFTELVQDITFCSQTVKKPNNNTTTDRVSVACSNAGNNSTPEDLALCMECLYGYNTSFLCSRDNFANRPESFRVQLKDQDPNDVTQQSFIALNNDTTIVHDNNNENDTGYQIAAGYQYALEINATNHENETPTPGYDASFLIDGNNSTRTFKLKWHDVTNNAFCNDIEDQNKTVTFFNGRVIDLNISSDQVGKYDLNLFDKLWTRVDWDPTAMVHHTGTHFLTGTDCVENTSYVPPFPTDTTISGINLADVSGCDISTANHTNIDTAAEYTDTPLRVHPYTFDHAGVIPAAGPYTRTNGQTFIYINTPDADDRNMSYNMNGTFSAVGFDNGRLSNFVDQCYADDVNMTLYLQYQHAQPTDSEPFLSYDLIDTNTTDTNIIIRPRPTAVAGEPTYRFTTTGPLPITQDEQYFVKDMNGSITMDLGYNFKRTYNEPMNPRFIQMDDFNITYLNNPTSIAADLQSDFEIFGNKPLDQNITFLYGRSKPAKFFYEDIVETFVNTPVSIVAYCDLGFTVCQDRGIMAAFAGTNQEDWWLSIDHNTNDSDGDIVLTRGAIPEGAGNPTVTPQSPNALTIISNAIDSNVAVAQGANPTLPMTVEIDFDTNTALPRFTDDWLIYNEYNNSIPTPFYKVRFIGDSNWTGIGDEGMVVGTEASKRKTKRLDW